MSVCSLVRSLPTYPPQTLPLPIVRGAAAAEAVGGNTPPSSTTDSSLTITGGRGRTGSATSGDDAWTDDERGQQQLQPPPPPQRQPQEQQEPAMSAREGRASSEGRLSMQLQARLCFCFLRLCCGPNSLSGCFRKWV